MLNISCAIQLIYPNFTAVPYAKISAAPCIIIAVENLTLIIASAFNFVASFTIR